MGFRFLKKQNIALVDIVTTFVSKSQEKYREFGNRQTVSFGGYKSLGK